MKEIDIIAGCKSGNKLAQKCFVEQYSPQLFSICRRYIKDGEAAKDCLQESLVQVLKSISKYEEQGQFGGWISSITVRRCLSHIRSNKNKRTADLDFVAEPGRSDGTLYKLELDDVMKFVNQLPENMKIVINMYLVEGYSHKEIGDHLGINESSSRSILARARKVINERFSDSSMTIVHSLKSKKKVINN